MFQYATGKRLALHLGTPLKLDISEYGNDKRRAFGLSFFNTDIDIASPKEISAFRRSRKKMWRLLGIFRINKKQYVKERDTKFDPTILNKGNECYLEGWWQSEQYFKDIRGVLTAEFSLNESVTRNNPPYQNIRKQIEKSESIAIHVRRGDYVFDKKTSMVHGGICDVHYYNQAIEVILKKIRSADISFFIFSDDTEWTKKNIQIPHSSVTFVSSADATLQPHEEISLMSLCKHFIIANSSFSWWAAWLSKNSAKTIIAPRKWVNDEKDHDRHCPGWILL